MSQKNNMLRVSVVGGGCSASSTASISCPNAKPETILIERAGAKLVDLLSLTYLASSEIDYTSTI